VGERTVWPRLAHGVLEHVVRGLAGKLAGPHERDRELPRLHRERGVRGLLRGSASAVCEKLRGSAERTISRIGLSVINARAVAVVELGSSGR
jgi:hypothetical protein